MRLQQTGDQGSSRRQYHQLEIEPFEITLAAFGLFCMFNVGVELVEVTQELRPTRAYQIVSNASPINRNPRRSVARPCERGGWHRS